MPLKSIRPSIYSKIVLIIAGIYFDRRQIVPIDPAPLAEVVQRDRPLFDYCQDLLLVIAFWVAIVVGWLHVGDFLMFAGSAAVGLSLLTSVSVILTFRLSMTTHRI